MCALALLVKMELIKIQLARLTTTASLVDASPTRAFLALTELRTETRRQSIAAAADSASHASPLEIRPALTPEAAP
jgi:hypothetical protein